MARTCIVSSLNRSWPWKFMEWYCRSNSFHKSNNSSWTCIKL